MAEDEIMPMPNFSPDAAVTGHLCASIEADAVFRQGLSRPPAVFGMMAGSRA